MNYADVNLTDQDVLGGGSDTFSILQNTADLLEREYTKNQTPDDRQLEQA